jgi:hypothetical protein
MSSSPLPSAISITVVALINPIFPLTLNLAPEAILIQRVPFTAPEGKPTLEDKIFRISMEEIRGGLCLNKWKRKKQRGSRKIT